MGADVPNKDTEAAMRCHAKFLIPLLSPVILALVLAATITAGSPSIAQAEGLRAEPMKVMPLSPRAAKGRMAGFDWLAKRPSATPASAQVYLASMDGALPRQIGRGSWICSPAGFGKKSRCHAN